MNLPFTQVQFFEVFAAYNLAVWPAQFALTLVAVAMVVLIIRVPEKAGRPVSYGLAALWAWLAIAYHLKFFWSINPAAPIFAAVSIAAAIAFAWLGGVKARLQFQKDMSATAVVGLVVIILALAVYPAIGAYLGHRYPALPTFGLPCPTTMFTFGILLMAVPTFPKVLVAAPLVWAVIGSSAAFALGVTQDLGLVVVAALGIYLPVRRATSPSNPLQMRRP